jgi:hypothetical protein
MKISWLGKAYLVRVPWNTLPTIVYRRRGKHEQYLAKVEFVTTPPQQTHIILTKQEKMNLNSNSNSNPNSHNRNNCLMRAKTDRDGIFGKVTVVV